MTYPVSASSPRLTRLQIQARAQAPAQQEQADSLTLSSGAVLARTFAALVAVRKETDPDKLRALDAEALRLLATPGLPEQTQGLLHLLRCGAAGQLVLRGVERKDNGKLSWEELHLAVKMAPERIEVAQVYSRSILGMAKLGFIKRKVVTHVVGADLKDEAAAADALLARFPDDPKCVLVRQKLMDVHKNKELIRQAVAGVARLDARDPAGMAAARQELGMDAIKVASVEDQ